MSTGGHYRSPGAGQSGRGHKPWFAPNRSGFGLHPTSWQGWLVIAVAVGLLVTVVVLLRRG